MKKLIMTAVVAALAFSSTANAELQMSGNVTTLVGYQHDQGKAGVTGVVVTSAGGLTQGDFNWNDTASADHFGFSVPEAEIDFENEFGKNIRARIDVDFIDVGTPSASFVLLEQAYVTANINGGNGIELMVGKFNCTFGLESVDRADNVFVTFTPGWFFLEPTQVMGAKIYYEFNDTWNIDIAAVNSLNNVLTANSAFPSGMIRFGAKWGEEGNASNINLGIDVGPELSAVTTATPDNKHLDLLGGMWGSFALGDAWDLGWEAIYRQTNSESGVGANQKAMAGQLYAAYGISDKWSVQGRGAALWEVNPANARGGSGASTTGATWSSFEGVTYSGTLGATYIITDGAKLSLEYRLDYAATAGATANPMFNTAVAQFAYNF